MDFRDLLGGDVGRNIKTRNNNNNNNNNNNGGVGGDDETQFARDGQSDGAHYFGGRDGTGRVWRRARVVIEPLPATATMPCDGASTGGGFHSDRDAWASGRSPYKTSPRPGGPPQFRYGRREYNTFPALESS